jgi:hypothetical protein
MAHSSSLTSRVSRRHTAAYNGVDRRVPYTTSESPDLRARETLMDAHVVLTETLAQVNNLGMWLYQQKLSKEHEQLRNIAFGLQRSRGYMQKSLSIVEFTGKQDRRLDIA